LTEFRPANGRYSGYRTLICGRDFRKDGAGAMAGPGAFR